jgi:UDP-N-acetylglucosamine--N-acetylmuramyl-(pentapeptide) pyrophosphoryl-undecaprenol N-acetylglucosamine transferase
MQAIAEQLLADGVPGGQLRYVGSRRGQEAALLAGGSVALTLLPGRGIRRSLSLRALIDNAVAVAALAVGVGVAVVKVGRWRPAVVVSVGGYASFATSLAAVIWRRPLVLVEFDAVPGASHRVLSRFATRRCTAFATDEPRGVMTGAPLRRSITSIDRSFAARQVARLALVPPIEAGRGVVVVMSGSLGATRVNRAASGLAALWAERSDRTLIHVTGRRDFDQTVARRPVTPGLDYRIIAFANMVELWGVCDAAVCRSGATSVAELTALGIASILVPLPGAPGDHQTKNAQSLVRAGGARMIRDAQCTPEALAGALEEIMEPVTLAELSEAARSLGRLDAASGISQVVRDVGGLQWRS